MDPLSILSLTSSIVQLIDFSSKLVSKGYKIHNSANGLLIDFADLSSVATHLLRLNEQLKQSLGGDERIRNPDPIHKTLFEVCDGCTSVARQLIAAIDQLRIRGRRTRWKSVRQAFKSIYGQHVINEMKARLESHRKVLDSCLLVALKQGEIICGIELNPGVPIDTTDTVSADIGEINSSKTDMDPFAAKHLLLAHQQKILI